MFRAQRTSIAPPRLRAALFAAAWCAWGGAWESAAAEPLHVRIDALLAEANPAGQAPIAADAEYLRRTFLALHGMIPTAAEARAFLADPAPDKRAKLVDSLLADPQFAKWMAVRLDVMLMERRGEAHTKMLPWRAWLETSLRNNKPWDALVRDLLTADSAVEEQRPVARWLLERQADPNALAREAARLFLGRDIGCAQCHDHPKIDDYVQRDYAGLHAFFNRTYLFQPDAAKPALVGEQAAGEVTYVSVFTNVGGGTKPRLPGEAEMGEPDAAGAWIVPPNAEDKSVLPVPGTSRRAMLAAALGDGHHPAFRRNIANRLWALVLGRGLVEPLDLQHSRNPASNPALMDLLAEEVAAMNFDIRSFVRELALTEAFQRTLELPDLAPEATAAVAEKLPALEQRAEALAATASAVEEETIDARQATIALQKASEPAVAKQATLAVALAEAEKVAAASEAEHQKAAEALAAMLATRQILAEAAAKANEALAKAGESPDLAAAAKTFQVKADTTAGAIPAAEQGAAATKADAEAKALALANARQAAAEAEARLAEANKAIAAQQAVYEAASARREIERAQARNAAAVAARVKAAATHAAAGAAETIALDDAARADAALAAVRQDIARLTAEVAAAPERIAALETAAAAALADLATTTQAMAAKIPAAEALAAAAAKAAEAGAKLPDDAEILQAAAAVKAASDGAAAEVAAMQAAMANTQAESDAMPARLAEARSAADKARADLAASESMLATLESAALAARARADEQAASAAEAREILAAAWARSFAASELIPLSPEQLCWSMARATGILEVVRENAIRDYDAANPMTDADREDPTKMAARAGGIESAFRDQFRPHEDQFARLFGGAAGQPQTDFFATPEQALFFENGGTVRSWTNILAARASALPDARSAAEEIYLSVLTRLPGEDEIADVAAMLAARPPEKKSETLNDYAWALLTSTEFRFLH